MVDAGTGQAAPRDHQRRFFGEGRHLVHIMHFEHHQALGDLNTCRTHSHKSLSATVREVIMTRRRGIKINNYYDDGADHVGDLNISRTHSHKSLVVVREVIMTKRRGIKINNY